MRNLTVVDNPMIDALARNPQHVADFPCLAQYQQRAATRRGCGRCRHKGAAVTQAYEAIKQCLVGMGPAKIALLKKRLDTHKLRIIVQTGRSIQQITI